MLLFQIHDIALGNPFDLDAVVQSLLSSWGENVPDHIWIVDTSANATDLMIVKEQAAIGESVHDRFIAAPDGEVPK